MGSAGRRRARGVRGRSKTGYRERAVNKFKQYRGISIGYDKLEVPSLALVQLAAVLISPNFAYDLS
jgi:hypothetical protein